MDNKNEIKPVFPEDFARLEAPLKEAQAKINDIDRKIGQLPDDRDPRLNFDPPGYGNNHHVETREQKIARMNTDREDVRKEFEHLVEIKLIDTDPKSAAQVRDIANYQLSDNPYNTAIAKNGKTKTTTQNEFSAFDKIEHLQFANEISIGPDQDQSPDDKEQYTLDEMTDRFLAKLDYPEGNIFDINAKDITLDDREQ